MLSCTINNCYEFNLVSVGDDEIINPEVWVHRQHNTYSIYVMEVGRTHGRRSSYLDLRLWAEHNEISDDQRADPPQLAMRQCPSNSVLSTGPNKT